MTTYYLLLRSLIFLSLASLSLATSQCSMNADCGANQLCQMYDFYNLPSMWPPCPHFGFCVCVSGTVQVTNGSCLPFMNLNLGDRCTNQANEIIKTPDWRCDGNRVVCNTPLYNLVQGGGYCQMAAQPTSYYYPTPAPQFYSTAGYPTFTQQQVQILTYLNTPCDSTRRLCDVSRGLCCQQRGPTQNYTQCLCCDQHSTFDTSIGYCRPRVYADECLQDEDCNSGLIASVGYQCRLGQCRCQAGYDPVDNTYWNYTSATTYTRRICVISAAVTWVPTGQPCTVNPEQWSQFNNTMVCQKRAFCHQCYKDRSGGSGYGYGSTGNFGNLPGYNSGSALSVSSTGNVGSVGGYGAGMTMGTCRELTCGSDGDCAGGQNPMKCNNYAMMIDPPCQNGMCDCPGNGFYMDRFSRCDSYELLDLGDRCAGYPGLHPWYQDNEDWDATTQTCINDIGQGQAGYAGWSRSIIKCQLPLIEDVDGNCVHNDNGNNLDYNYIGYGQPCNDADLRLPLTRCDTTQSLQCVNNRCNCTQGGFGGNYFWDGTQCRINLVSTVGYTCPVGTTQVPLYTLYINNVRAAGITNQTSYCFRNFSVVNKGDECHLQPVQWYTTHNDVRRYGPVLVCSQGLYCIRCPADYGPDDENRGICRTYQPLPPVVGGCNLQPSAPTNPPYPSQNWAPSFPAWTSWNPVPTWNNWIAPIPTWNNWIAPVAPVWSNWIAPVPVWSNWIAPVPAWSSWVAPVQVWSNWQSPQQPYPYPVQSQPSNVQVPMYLCGRNSATELTASSLLAIFILAVNLL